MQECISIGLSVSYSYAVGSREYLHRG